MAYSIGFDAGLGLELGLDAGKRIHGPIGVREAVYLCKALYLGIPLYLCKPLYLNKAPSGSREKPAAVYLNKAVYDTVSG